MVFILIALWVASGLLAAYLAIEYHRRDVCVNGEDLIFYTALSLLGGPFGLIAAILLTIAGKLETIADKLEDKKRLKPYKKSFFNKCILEKRKK